WVGARLGGGGEPAVAFRFSSRSETHVVPSHSRPATGVARIDGMPFCALHERLRRPRFTSALPSALVFAGGALEPVSGAKSGTPKSGTHVDALANVAFQATVSFDSRVVARGDAEALVSRVAFAAAE